MYWIVGKKGMLAQALTEEFKRKSIPFVVTSSHEVDISQSSQVEEFLRQNACSYVINAAAFTHVDQVEENPEKAYAINANGPKNLAIACREHGSKLIHISTDYVFDGCADTPYEETDRCHPVNVYGMTKLYGEQNILQESEDFCIIRTSSLYGPYGHNFPDRIRDLVKVRPSLSVVRDQIACPTYIKDLVEAILLLKDVSGIVHFANTGAVSRYEWAQYIFALCQKDKMKEMVCKEIVPVNSNQVRTVAMRPLYTELSTEKYTALTQQVPRDWQTAFNEYWENIPC